MATWDAAYCLANLKRLIGRTGTDSVTDATYYQMLSEAQNEVIADIAAVVPHVLYPTAAYTSLPTMTIAASGQTATFGTDMQGYPNFFMGKGGIFRSLDDIPTAPMIEGIDFMNEGTQIRALNNGTLPSTIYAYGIFQPGDIGAGGSAEPALKPESSRQLITLRAAYNFGSEGNRNVPLAQTMAARYGYPLAANPGRFAWWCQTWKTSYRGRGGALSWTGRQLAQSGWPGYGAGQYFWGT